MTHTATPWVFNGGDSLPILHIYAPDNKHVFHESRETSEHEANAAFIVKAVNAHDELVELISQISLTPAEDWESNRENILRCCHEALETVQS